ncbi:Fe-S cluster assembly protein SufD [Fuerstiella marisgermanici]|uniref:FeS cluster assembly protein SufB n=1 Tax=Fuerstiella marisgermanici TaxID=1891926 RepID=A0A1P8WB02_9PLAN|nr:Fe-S cluster assembly protein SufD [Fuerstiella marisgermanici]APZ91257.1 FeS cluster assembly protein SufB [Fuerstiella marisgermanici]
MTATINISRIAFDAEVFETFLDSRVEPSWITDARRAAFAQYQQLVNEDLDPEEFKRVDLRIFNAGKFRPATGESDASSVSTLLANETEYGGSIGHVDGQTTHANFNGEIKAKGVLFGDLQTLLTEHRELLEPYFMTQAVKPDADRFSAWHAAFWTSGTLLYVPKGVEVDLPLHSLIAHTKDGVADFGHTLIIVEDEARATLLEETTSADENISGLHVGCVELIVGKHSNLRYVQLQNWNQKTWHFAHQAGNVDSEGSLQWTVVGLGSKLSHIHQDVNLNGRASTAEVNGVTFACDRQKISYYTQQHHKAQGTHSDLLYKEVLRDESRVIWRGMIKVDEAAQQTDGYQRSDALMLSRDARCDSIPGLEIEADDVRCTHGATTGQVDEEQIFYAQSRGISENEAMHMIVEGFFQQVYDRIPIEIVRETLSRTVQSKLGIESMELV